MGSVNRVIDDATDQLERSTGIKTGRAQNVSTHTYSTYSRGTATRERQKQLERERRKDSSVLKGTARKDRKDVKRRRNKDVSARPYFLQDPMRPRPEGRALRKEGRRMSLQEG